MKKLLTIAAILITLTSCGKSYIVRDLSTNEYISLESSEIGDTFKEGDTVRTQNVHRATTIGNAFQTTKFTGIILLVK